MPRKQKKLRIFTERGWLIALAVALGLVLGLVSPTGKLGSLGGNLSITSNPQLNLCQPAALKAALVASQSWNKTYTQSQNQSCDPPKACVGAQCQ